MKPNKILRVDLSIFGFVFMLFIVMGFSAPEDDKIAGIPGYPDNFDASVYAGYLKTSS